MGSAPAVRVLLFGSGGMLAHDLVRLKPPEIVVTPLTRQDLDIRDVAGLERAIEQSQAHWVLNCAGLTNVDAAEVDRDTAFAVNSAAVERMAALCLARDIRLLHFSTDYVFDGTVTGFYSEDDTPRPVNVYGESKLAGEEALQLSGVRHLLIRTQWLFGTRGRSFVRLMCDRARARHPTRVVADQTGCFTYTVDLARATWDLIGRDTEGTVHVANRGKVSRYALAARIFEHYGVGPLVTSCTTEEFGFTTRRPANSALSVRRVERLLHREMPSWQDALGRYLTKRDAVVSRSAEL
jgi:dTDP-4-dehydrorhamnose reductase